MQNNMALTIWVTKRYHLHIVEGGVRHEFILTQEEANNLGIELKKAGQLDIKKVSKGGKP